MFVRRLRPTSRVLGRSASPRCSSATTRPPTSTSASSTRPRRRSGSTRATSGFRPRPPRPSCSSTWRELNADDSVHGILVQLPLPAGLDEAAIIAAIDPTKDVDGLHPFNAGQLLLGRPTFVGATPLGVLALLDEYDVELAGARAVVIGRSDIVGKPAALLLLQRHATVTICHSRTRDLGAEVASADVVVAAVGVPASSDPTG